MNVALRLLMRGESAPAGLSGGTYLTSLGDEVDRTTYSWTGVAIGAASGSRNVIVGIVGRTATTAAVSSVTIGGVTASLVISSGAGTQTGAIYRALVPSGTTATIDVTFSAGMIRAAVNVWTLLGTINTESADAIGGSGTLSRAVTGAAGGFIVATGYKAAASANYTWTNATERFEGSPGPVSSMTIAAADATTVGSTTITAAPGAGSTVLVVAAFGP